MSKFGIGLIGAGSFGAAHARALAELANVELVAASRTDAQALDAFIRQYGGRGYTDYRELLADPRVQIAVIAGPHHLHCEMAVRAAQARKPILLEKPMAITLQECDEILRAVEQARVALMVGHVSRFVPAYRAAKEILDSGELGSVVVGLSTLSKSWDQETRRPWHLDRALGGGMWLTSGIHPLERLCWLVGSRVTRVYAQMGTCFHEQPADDTALASVCFESGAMGAVVSVGYRTGASKHLTELTCTRGVMAIDYALGVKIGRDEKWQEVPNTASELWLHEGLVAEWRAFLAALEHGREAPVSGESARVVMQVLFAAEQSAQTGQTVLLA